MDGAVFLPNHDAAISAYVEGVVAGEITAGRYVRLACERHLRDLERAEAGGPYLWDASEANFLCAWVEAMPHAKAEWAARGETIRLEPWQAWYIGSLNGWRERETGLRRFRTAYLEVARKNAKSTMAAAVALYLLAADGEAGPDVYAAATKMKPARMVFDTGRVMARKLAADPSSTFRRLGLRIEEHRIRSADRAGEFSPLEAKALDG
ncbi:MAG: terminase large subunit, partial [Pseudomonadota bacterium]